MRAQLLLCGTQYGQVYLPAIFESKEFELAALLAKGSARSQKMSEQCGVSLYTDVNHIDEAIDIAVVAIGGPTGVDIAKKILEKNIPVLIEHPIDIRNIETLLATANAYKTTCHINSHFSHIAPITDFIKLCQSLNKSSCTHIITVSCNSRTLFSTLDILMRSFGMFDISDFDSYPIANSSYQQISFSIHGVPCNLVYQRWRAEEDNSKDSPLGHQITVTYQEGVLLLGGTFGPCLWFPLLAGGIPAQIPLFSALEQQKNSVPSQADVIHWRKVANYKSMLELWGAQRNENSNEYQTCEFLTKLCKNWTLLFNNFPVEIQEDTIKSIGNHFWTASSIIALSSDARIYKKKIE